MCMCCITKPKDLPEKESERFFETAYKFLENRYGKDNVISSYVHLDETSPHMHFAFVPVAFDVKKKRLTVSAKMKVCKTDLQTLHPDLTKAMFLEFGYDVKVENGATKEGNITIAQLKEQTKHAEELAKENALLKEQNSSLANDLMRIDKAINDVKEPYEAVKAYKALKPFLGFYRASDVDKALNKHLFFDKLQKELKEANKAKDNAVIECEMSYNTIREIAQEKADLEKKYEYLDIYGGTNDVIQSIEYKAIAEDNIKLRKMLGIGEDEIIRGRE